MTGPASLLVCTVLCAVGGPIVGFSLLNLTSLLPGPEVWRTPSSAVALLGFLFVLYAYAIALYGLQSGVVGALGAWLLIKQLQRGATRHRLAILGAVYGGFAGLVPPLSFLVLRLGVWGFVGDLVEFRRNCLVGIVAGALMGVIVALLIVARGVCGHSPAVTSESGS